MGETAALRISLTERGVKHSDIGMRDTRWESGGVTWYAHEGYDGAIWLRVARPLSVDEVMRVTADGK